MDCNELTSIHCTQSYLTTTFLLSRLSSFLQYIVLIIENFTQSEVMQIVVDCDSPVATHIRGRI